MWLMSQRKYGLQHLWMQFSHQNVHLQRTYNTGHDLQQQYGVLLLPIHLPVDHWIG